MLKRINLLLTCIYCCCNFSSFATESEVVFLFDRPWSFLDLEEIEKEVSILKNKKVAFSPALLSKESNTQQGYEFGNPLPYALSKENGCDFDPCEQLNEFIKRYGPTVVFVNDPDGSFSCDLAASTVYSVNGYEDINARLRDLVRKNRNRKNNPRILIYFDDNFDAKIPTVVLNGGTINEGESFDLIADPTTHGEGGIYQWKDFDSQGKVLNISPKKTRTYEVSYTTNGCTSPLAAAQVIVKPKPVCNPMEEFTLVKGDAGDIWVEYSEVFDEINFYPDPYRQDYYIIQLDSICPPDFITFYLEDSRDGKRNFIQLENLPFDDKKYSSANEVEAVYNAFIDDQSIYEIAFRTKEFSMGDEKLILYKFETNILYYLTIEASFNDDQNKTRKVISGPFEVVFYPCPK